MYFTVCVFGPVVEDSFTHSVRTYFPSTTSGPSFPWVERTLESRTDDPKTGFSESYRYLLSRRSGWVRPKWVLVSSRHGVHKCTGV